VSERGRGPTRLHAEPPAPASPHEPATDVPEVSGAPDLEPEPEDEQPRRPWRRREAFLLAATLLASFLFLVFETRLPPFTTGDAVSQNIVFFLLINLNIVLILLVVFLLGRNIVKLVVERRQRVLGSHLRTRLVGGFLLVAIVPAVLLFLVAVGFIRSSIESWFSVQVQSALEGALDMSDTYYREGMATALRDAREIAARVGATNKPLATQKPLLDSKRTEYAVAKVALFDAQGVLAQSVAAQHLGDAFEALPDPEFLSGALGRDESGKVVTIDGREVLRAAARVTDKTGEVRGLVLVDQIVPRSVTRRRGEIQQSVQQYKQLKLMRRPLINNYVMTLLVASLAVAFGGSWLGFVLARSITVPIQRLAEGTRRVAEGKLDERIQLESGSDEVAALVAAFNRMTANLQTTHSELAERGHTLETILANTPGGVVSIDRAGRIETVNAAARTLVGIEDQAVGQPFRRYFAAPEFDAIRELLAELETRAREGVWDTLPPHRLSVEQGDSVGQVLATGVVLRGDGGGAIGALLFFEDVTELLKVQRMEAWREVARRIAHEIKNPLTPIQLSAQRLRKRYAKELSGSVLDECTRTIIAEVEVLKNLVSEFAHFARLPAGPHVATDLNALIDEVLVLFREAHRGVRFTFDKDDALPLLDLDRDGMRRVLTNILDNAVGALSAVPGRVAPARAEGGDGEPAEMLVRGAIDVATRYDGVRGVVVLEIADDGIGMTPEVKARLFEPYFSTKPQGTGLGLAIASAVLADHQAFIRVRDNQPRGSRFSIELPVRERSLEVPRGAHA
jgi:two-component system nitrogen regulation sensor histidine kinase NtrY